MEFEIFLFSMLHREIYEKETSDMDYLTLYNTVVKLYEDFTNSPYDDSDIDLYTCMTDFLEDSKALIITYEKN